MRDLPTPTLPLSSLALSGRRRREGASVSPPSAALLSAPDAIRLPSQPSQDPPQSATHGIEVSWARHQDEVRAAQRLRYEVFAGEMGARLSTPVAGHDIDLFDDFCEHLLVRDEATQEVIGTYRVLTPAQARRVASSRTSRCSQKSSNRSTSWPSRVVVRRAPISPANTS